MSEEIYYDDSSPASSKVIQVELTPAQYSFLLKMMPNDYRLELLNKPKKQIIAPPPPLVKKSSSVVQLKKPVAPKPEPSSTRITLDIPSVLPVTRQTSQTIQPVQKPKPSSPLTFTIPPQAVQQTNEILPPLELPPPKSTIINPPAPKKKIPSVSYLAPPAPITTSSGVIPTYQAPPEDMRKCQDLLKKIKSHMLAGPFLLPVDYVALKIPDYPKIIKEPMDLSTVDKNLRNNVYANPYQFAEDVRKIWRNAMTYNAENSPIYNTTVGISNHFEKVFKELENVITPPQKLQIPVKAPYDLEQRVKTLCKQINGVVHKGGKITLMDTQSTKYSTIKDQPMTPIEKKTLYQNVHRLPAGYLKGVWDIVNESIPPEKKNREVIDFDLEQLSTEIARKLERYVNFYTTLNKKHAERRAKQGTSSKRDLEPALQKQLKTDSADKKDEMIDEVSSVSSFSTLSDKDDEEYLDLSNRLM